MARSSAEGWSERNASSIRFTLVGNIQGEKMKEYHQPDIFICRPEKRTLAPRVDPSILERTDDGIPDKTQCETMGA